MADAQATPTRPLDEGMLAMDVVDTLRHRELLVERELNAIVTRPDELSGVWRVPERNPQARNVYIIVKAVTPDGTVLGLPITNQEDGKTYTVSKWGMRVDEPLFRQIAADKQDDGIIQNFRFGIKRRGQLAPEYLMPTTGAAITSW
jgi:hypothetical protein